MMKRSICKIGPHVFRWDGEIIYEWKTNLVYDPEMDVVLVNGEESDVETVWKRQAREAYELMRDWPDFLTINVY